MSKAFPPTNRPVIRPNSPRTELKISMTRILTNLRYREMVSMPKLTQVHAQRPVEGGFEGGFEGKFKGA
jgi:hypothetical protein